jgi:hypothetical protein
MSSKLLIHIVLLKELKNKTQDNWFEEVAFKVGDLLLWKYSRNHSLMPPLLFLFTDFILTPNDICNNF